MTSPGWPIRPKLPMNQFTHLFYTPCTCPPIGSAREIMRNGAELSSRVPCAAREIDQSQSAFFSHSVSRCEKRKPTETDAYVHVLHTNRARLHNVSRAAVNVALHNGALSSKFVRFKNFYFSTKYEKQIGYFALKPFIIISCIFFIHTLVSKS